MKNLIPIIFLSGCSWITVIPVDNDWLEHQRFCEAFVGAERNCVEEETWDGWDCVPVAMWCARTVNQDRFSEIEDDLDSAIVDLKKMETELLEMKEELEEWK